MRSEGAPHPRRSDQRLPRVSPCGVPSERGNRGPCLTQGVALGWYARPLQGIGAADRCRHWSSHVRSRSCVFQVILLPEPQPEPQPNPQPEPRPEPRPEPQRGFAYQPRATPWVRFSNNTVRSEGAPHPPRSGPSMPRDAMRRSFITHRWHSSRFRVIDHAPKPTMPPCLNRSLTFSFI